METNYVKFATNHMKSEFCCLGYKKNITFITELPNVKTSHVGKLARIIRKIIIKKEKWPSNIVLDIKQFEDMREFFISNILKQKIDT